MFFLVIFVVNKRTDAEVSPQNIDIKQNAIGYFNPLNLQVELK